MKLVLQYTIYFDTLESRDEGDRATIWETLGDSTNQKTIATTCLDTYNSAFNKYAVFIAAVDQDIYHKIANTLVACGISKNAMNL